MYRELALLETSNQNKTKLVKAGLVNLSDITKCNPGQISQKAKINKNQAESILNEARLYLDYLHSIKSISDYIKVKTNTELDSFFEGGVVGGAICQISGRQGSGKTLNCLKVAASVTSKAEKALYIDTEGGFSKLRFSQVVDELNFNQNLCASNCKFCRVTTEFQVKHILENLSKYLPRNCRVVVIDSISFLLKNAQSLWGLQKSKELVKLGLSLQRVAAENDLLVVVTNQLSSVGVPALGESWAAVVSFKVCLS